MLPSSQQKGARLVIGNTFYSDGHSVATHTTSASTNQQQMQNKLRSRVFGGPNSQLQQPQLQLIGSAAHIIQNPHATADQINAPVIGVN